MDWIIWVKAFHVVFMVTWFAGLFYLPRLYVYHADAGDTISLERFEIMERRLFTMMTIGGVLTVALGVWLLAAQPFLLRDGWMHAKLVLVVALSAYHAWCWPLHRALVEGRNRRSGRWFRMFNEVPSIALIAAVVLAVVRPF